MKKLVALAAAAILLFGMGAVDSAGALDWGLGVRGGIAEGTGDFGDASKTSFAWSLFLHYDLTPQVAAVVRYGRHVHGISSEFQRFGGIEIPGTVETGAGSVPATLENLIGDFFINEFAADLRVALPLSEKWRVFFQGGPGYYIWDLDLAFDTSEGEISTPGADDSSLGLNAGGGVEYVLNPEVSVTVDGDYTRIYGDFDDGFWAVYGGFVFRFGGER